MKLGGASWPNKRSRRLKRHRDASSEFWRSGFAVGGSKRRATTGGRSWRELTTFSSAATAPSEKSRNSVQGGNASRAASANGGSTAPPLGGEPSGGAHGFHCRSSPRTGTAFKAALALRAASVSNVTARW